MNREQRNTKHTSGKVLVLKLVSLLRHLRVGSSLICVILLFTLYLRDGEPHWLKSATVGAPGWSDNIGAEESRTDGVKRDWFCPWVVDLSLSPSRQSQGIHSSRKTAQQSCQIVQTPHQAVEPEQCNWSVTVATVVHTFTFYVIVADWCCKSIIFVFCIWDLKYLSCFSCSSYALSIGVLTSLCTIDNKTKITLLI